MPKFEEPQTGEGRTHGHGPDVECPLCFKEREIAEAEARVGEKDREIDTELRLIAEASGKDVESLKNTFGALGLEALKEELGEEAEEMGIRFHLGNLEAAERERRPLKLELEKRKKEYEETPSLVAGIEDMTEAVEEEERPSEERGGKEAAA